MAWIPSYQELRDHPKVYAFADEAGISIPEAIGHLHLLWWWAIDHAPDGNLAGFSELAVSRAGLWNRDDDFVALLIKAGFLDEDWKLHNWNLYAGRFAAINEARKEAGKRGAEARWGRKTPGQMASPSQPHSNGVATPMQEVEEEREVDRSKTLSAKKVKKATSLPKGWAPTDEMAEWARLKHPLADPDFETEQFKDHAQANGRTQKDWNAAWRTWIRNAHKWALKRGEKPSQNGRAEENLEVFNGRSA